MKTFVGYCQGQRGAVLIIVLWVIMLLSMLLATYTRSIRVETGIVRGMVSDASMHAVAEGVVSYLAKVMALDAEKLRALEGSEQEIIIGSQVVNFRMIPEASFVSLNSAPVEMLQVLISNLSEDVVDAQSLAAAIVDWRDPDDLPLELGAEKDEYEAAGMAWHPRNNNFESAGELQLVLGMTPLLSNRLKEYVSLYSKSEVVNPRHAPPELIELLGGEAIKTDEFGLDDESDPLISDDGFFAVNQSDTYRIQMTLVVNEEKQDNGLQLTVSFGASEPTFELKGDQPPYHIKQWSRYTSPVQISDE